MVRIVRLLGLLALGLVLSSPSRAESSTRRIVVFHAGVSAAQRLALATNSGAKIVRELPLIDAVVIESDASQLAAAEGKLTSLPEVKRIDADPRINWLRHADARGADFVLPSYKGILAPLSALKAKKAAPQPAPEAQRKDWGIDRVEAPAAWATSRGQGVKVVVIDTGIDGSHPDLAGNVKGGWNTISKDENFKDDHGHGSHCAGVIAALDNNIGVVGVANKADLYGVKVLDANGSGTFDDVIAGMQWAVEHKMDVASMSLGADAEYGNDALKDAVAAMAKNGVTLVAAAGNSGGPVGVPAAYPGAVAVAASDKANAVAYFSSRGPEVAVIAPGVNVYSTVMNGGYETMSGTSMATPHVSGLAALYVATHKGATPAQVRDALRAAAVKLPNAPEEQQGAGLPKAPKLVKQL